LGSSSGVGAIAASAATTTTTTTTTVSLLPITCQVNSKTDLGREGCCHNECLGDHHFEISFVVFLC